jgi:hypothetical protein
MQVARVGSFEIPRVAEYRGPFLAPYECFPDFDPEVVRANRELRGPRLDPGKAIRAKCQPVLPPPPPLPGLAPSQGPRRRR